MESAIYPNVITVENEPLSFSGTTGVAGGGATFDLGRHSTDPKMVLLSIVDHEWAHEANAYLHINAMIPIQNDETEEYLAATAIGINFNNGAEKTIYQFNIGHDIQNGKLKIFLSNMQTPNPFSEPVANAVIIE